MKHPEPVPETAEPTATSLRSAAVYDFGPYRLNAATREFTKDGEAVQLTGKVFDTLLILVTHRARVVTKEELIASVWPGSFVSDDSLVQNISALRRTLRDDSNRPTYIVTLARRGYRFIAPVHEYSDVRAATPPDQSPTSALASDETTSTAVVAEPKGSGQLARTVRSGTVRSYAAAAVATAAIALGVGAIAGTSLVATRRPSSPTGGPVSLFQEHLPASQTLVGDVSVSPDGRTLAFSARGKDGVIRVWVRALDTTDAYPLAGTEGGTGVFWSPDSHFLGFASGGEIKRLGLATKSIRGIVSPARVTPVGASWGTGDAILYGDLGKVFSVPAGGGAPSVVAASNNAFDLGELRLPQALPDGRHFLLYASGAVPDQAGTFLATPGMAEPVRLLRGFRGTFAPPNYLLYVRDHTLIAQRFDMERGVLEGAPLTLPGQVPTSAHVSTSHDGSVLVISAVQARQRLVWLDRQGKQLAAVASPMPLADLALSPNGHQVLAATYDGGYELWLVDLERNVSSKVAVNGTFASWSPDGSRFAYTLVGPDGADLYVQSVLNPTKPTPLLKSKELKAIESWSPDGRQIVFSKYTPREQTSQDLWLLPITGDNRQPVPLVRSKASERGGSVSPDGRWLAFVSDETGAREVYVQSFPTPGIKVRVSNEGGSQPMWRADGRELFYVSAAHSVVAVGISGGVELKPGMPQPLFALPSFSGGLRQVAVSADGQRFLAPDWEANGEESRVTIVTNWEAALQP